MVTKPGTGPRTRRRQLSEAVVGLALGAVAIAAIASCVATYLPHKAEYPYIPVVNAIGVPASKDAPAADDTPGSHITSIPVLSWHQMDNGCAAAATQCTAAEYSADNVTQRQFYEQVSWLHSRGYRTVTAEQYDEWATGKRVMLPAKPVLMTVDDGIDNFYAGATPVLQHFGYTMVSMVVSGFAQGAQDGARQYKGWDATWKQLNSLPSDTWEFAFHAGLQGHTVSGAGCSYYTCQRPGESASAYQARVAADIDGGIAAMREELGSRADTAMWAAPFNALAQAADQPKSGSAPQKWLTGYAASKFAVVFVDEYASGANQHYRYEVHGTDDLSYFASQVLRTGVYTTYQGSAAASGRAGRPS